MSTVQSRRPVPIWLGVLTCIVLVATLALAGWQLLAGSRMQSAAAWLNRADEWRSLLLATAISIEDETLTRAEGGYTVPWETEGAHAFPIDAQEAPAEAQGMAAAYPLTLEQVSREAERMAESHEVLRRHLLALKELEPLAPIEQLPPSLHAAAADVTGMMRPVTALLADESRAAALARLAFAITAAGAALLALGLFLRLRAVTRERDRLQRHVIALEGRGAS